MAHRFQWSRKKRSDVFGQKPEVKTFYENVVEPDSGPHWVEWAPPVYPRSKRDRWEGYAIQEYKKCDDLWDPLREQSFSLAHIRILSPFLRDQLRPLIEPYGISFDDGNFIKINAPLHALFCERDKIQELSDKAEGQEREHFELLLNFMRVELGTTLEETADLAKENKITHRLLWTLFPKDTIVVRPTTEGEQTYQGFRLLKHSSSDIASGSFFLDCQHIRFDGQCYGTRTVTLSIPYFQGKRDVTSLPVYPINNLGHMQENIRGKMIERGKKVLGFQDVHYMRYMENLDEDFQRSSALDKLGDEWNGKSQSRIIVDFQLSRKHGHTQSTTLLPGYFDDEAHKSVKRERVAGRSARHRNRGGHLEGCSCLSCERMRREMELIEEQYTFRRLTADEQTRNSTIASRNEEDLLVLDPFLDGFCLTSKEWKSFDVERVATLDLNLDAFNFLVHAEKNKSLVCAVVEHHARRSLVSQDVIAGKGQGLLILLSGNPGTGKTLMAEAIADKTMKPLYYVDSRDLGHPEQIESSLSRVMADAAAWNAILLLDEADVYLQQRSAESMERNKVVAVFLRLLEYYKGIMFLTTNLWESLDEAVESRIQIHLRFPNLDHASRSQIWQNLLLRSGPEFHEMSPEDIVQIGKWVINGRQIRNVSRMAEAWSKQVGQIVDLEMLQTIIPASCPKAYKEGDEPPEGTIMKVAGDGRPKIPRNGSVTRVRPLSDGSIDLLIL